MRASIWLVAMLLSVGAERGSAQRASQVSFANDPALRVGEARSASIVDSDPPSAVRRKSSGLIGWRLQDSPRRGRTVLKGAAYGAVAGAAVGLIIRLPIPRCSPGATKCKDISVARFTAISALVGAGIGALWGVASTNQLRSGILRRDAVLVSPGMHGGISLGLSFGGGSA